MKLKYHNMAQGSNSWYDIRLGKVTASRMKDFLSNGRSKDSKMGATCISYANELIAEMITGKSPFQTNQACQWGIDHEDEARKEYEFLTETEVKEVGFITNKNEICGMSPDGLIGDFGLIEIKCPFTSKNHVLHLLGEIPKDYYLQMQYQLFISERKWCDFVSYDPRVIDESKRLYIKRVVPDPKIQENIEERIKEFSELLFDIQKKLEDF